MSSYRTFVPIVSGRGAAKRTGEEVKALGCKKVLLVHGPTLPTSSVDVIKKSLNAHGIEFAEYGNALPDVPDYIVEEAVAFAKEVGGIDGIVGLGGGSTMDTAKAINLMLNNPAPIQQYFAINGGVAKNPGYPLILIPTTSGTGSDQTRAAVVMNTSEDVKRPLLSDICCLAKVCILDPEMAVTMPPFLTAFTGYDAFSHAYEAYTGDDESAGPISDVLAVWAMETIVKYLPLAIEDGSNLEYREMLANAATIAGMSTANARSHLGHCFGHAIGSRTHAPHGVSVACNLPFIVDFVTDANYEKNSVVAKMFGIDVYEGMPAEELGAKLREALQNFENTIGCPTLKDYNVTRQKVMDSYDLIVVDPLFQRGKKHMTTEEAKEILVKICDYYDLE